SLLGYPREVEASSSASSSPARAASRAARTCPLPNRDHALVIRCHVQEVTLASRVRVDRRAKSGGPGRDAPQGTDAAHQIGLCATELLLLLGPASENDAPRLHAEIQFLYLSGAASFGAVALDPVPWARGCRLPARLGDPWFALRCSARDLSNRPIGRVGRGIEATPRLVEDS